ncbi:MAG: V-type ATP synthase subunit F [Thiotrichales bacterium]
MSKPLLPVSSEARLVVLGSAALTDGFALIGAEVYPDASARTVEEVLSRLVREGARALVLIEHALARGGGEWLTRLRNEGGGIVVTELPPLNQPGAFAPAVDEVVRMVLGADALEESR